MRFTLAGLILLGFSSLGFAQISGEVESIGFNNTYRPDCFTPMVIRIKPQGGGDNGGGLYQIQVKQKDLDGDDVTFSRWISVTAGDGAQDQRFSMYFLPTPTGLPDPSQGKTLRDLQKVLKVFLYNQSGKQIATLPVTSNSIMSIDPQGLPMDQRRGTHFILTVVGNGSAPSWDEYRNSDELLGVMEDAVFVSISPRDLPENPIAYDAVDDVLWMNADPAEMKRGGDDKFRALQTWIHRGGHLVICQSPEWQKYLDFGDLLPVTIQSIDQKKDPQPLASMVPMSGDIDYLDQNQHKVLRDPWIRLTGPFSIARAQAKPNTVIDEWVDWDAKGADRTPYIVRQAVGMGGVTWVAQDLGDPSLTASAKLGWVNIWDKIFDWHNSPAIKAPYTSDSTVQSWSRSGAVDLGPGLVGDALNQTGTVSTLIAVALAFFIIYWLIAGPGLFLHTWSPSARQKSQCGFSHAFSALVATAVTVLIVKLIVRGPPSLTHVSTISAAAGEPAIVNSNFGLYIKADGPERIELTGTDPGSVSTLTPLPIHPDYMTQSDDSSGASSIDYEVPTREVSTTEPPVLTIYYRSTMKKFQARWIGNISGRIEGSAETYGCLNIDAGQTTQRYRGRNFAVNKPGRLLPSQQHGN